MTQTPLPDAFDALSVDGSVSPVARRGPGGRGAGRASRSPSVAKPVPSGPQRHVPWVPTLATQAGTADYPSKWREL
jgi:hypothetical protein